VPGRSRIEVHPGNDTADTEGCILLGLQQTTDHVLESREAVHAFAVLIGPVLEAGGHVYIRVEQPASPFTNPPRLTV
jgi:predicted esterase YcpF (UPF0227 family)